MKTLILSAAAVATASIAFWLVPATSSFSRIADDDVRNVTGGGCIKLQFQKACGKVDGGPKPIDGDECVDKTCFVYVGPKCYGHLELQRPDWCSRLGSNVCGAVETDISPTCFDMDGE
ncbi:MAG: hypothetical protein H6837_14935 [Planctomycetes bacterium]|nr:hypothetical protein [Planctomycetota bacterium]